MKALFTSAIFRLLLGTAFISISPFFVEFSQLDAFTNAFYRSLLGGIVFLVIALVQKASLPSLRTFAFCILAALTISLDLFLWNQSVLFIGAGLGTILANLEIIFMVLIGVVFFHEKLNPLFWGMCLLIALGIFLLIQPHFTQPHPNVGLGVTIALFASFVFSIYLFLIKVISSDYPFSMIPLLAIICLSSACMTAFCIFFFPHTSFAIPNIRGLVCITLNGLVSQVFGWILITYGIKNLHFSLSGLLLFAQPAFTFFLDCVIFKRNTHFTQILGSIFLLSGIFFTTLLDNRSKEKAQL